MIIPTIFLSKYFYSNGAIGMYESFIIYASVFSFFWLAAIFTTVLSNNSTREENAKNISNAFSAIHLINLIIIAVVVLSNMVHTYLEPTFLLPLTIYLFCNNASFIIENKYLLFKEDKKLVLYGVVFFLVQILLAFVAVAADMEIIYLIYIVVLFAIVRYVFSLFVIKDLGFSFDKNAIGSLLVQAFPLLFSFFIAGIAEYVDAFIVKHHYNNGELAIYRYGTREIPFVILLANALSVSMIPLIRANLDGGIKELKNRSSYLMHISFGGTILLVLTCRYWYPIVFNEQFLLAVPYFLVSSLLVISRCIFPQTILQAMQEYKLLLYFSISELIINIAASLILLQYFGALGVVYGTLIAFSFDKIVQTVYVCYYKKIPLSSFTNIPLYAMYSVLLTLAVFVAKKNLI